MAKIIKHTDHVPVNANGNKWQLLTDKPTNKECKQYIKAQESIAFCEYAIVKSNDELIGYSIYFNLDTCITTSKPPQMAEFKAVI
jgi:hypothetical protein